MRYAIFAIAILLALHGCAGTQPQGNQTVNGTGITQAMCQDAGGHWNAQGTCCRDLPEGKPCNMFCVAVCECGGIAGFRCPAGYACGDYYPNNTTPDAMGVCKRS